MIFLQTFVASLIIFGLIIFFHEFGHYLLAKITGVRVEEFALGMGPKIVAKKWGETIYSIRALPLGGFCRMAGETGSGDYESSASHDPRRFDQKPVWARIAVIASGPLMNFVLAVFIFTALFSAIGIPEDYTTKIGSVVAGSPAEQAGLRAGDRVERINGIDVNSWRELVSIIHGSAGKKIELEIARGKSTIVVEATPKLDPESNVGMIGITPEEPRWKKVGFWEGLKNGYQRTVDITRLTIVGLVEMITGRTSTEGIAGPVGIIQMIGESARFGLVYLVNLTALISINLGLINLLPIPALDGSRLLFLIFEGVRGRPVNPAKENFVHLVGFILLMVLMVFITYRDIIRIFV
ncbi:MAG: RIP metalloprotease RseP [Peptococcaceae bacterium]|nr:RIP metalloprotease RseP [Peptococcaceae bacterium]MDH7524075.1 RIP metalloprotease RseP [Peptococcaceae bacterium]